MSIVEPDDVLAWADRGSQNRRQGRMAEAKSLTDLAAVKRRQAKRRIKARLSRAQIESGDGDGGEDEVMKGAAD